MGRKVKIDWVVIFLIMLAAVSFGLIVAFVMSQVPLVRLEPQVIYPEDPPQNATERPRAAQSPTVIHVWPTLTPSTPTPTRYSNDEIDTLAATIAYEALGESMEGRLAVGCVIMRRARLEGKVPSEILTINFFGEERGAEQIARMKLWWKPDNNDIPMDDWQEITLLAINLANDWIGCPFDDKATHYYSRCLIDEPDWVKGMEFLGEIGCHRFYAKEE